MGFRKLRPVIVHVRLPYSSVIHLVARLQSAHLGQHRHAVPCHAATLARANAKMLGPVAGGDRCAVRARCAPASTQIQPS